MTKKNFILIFLSFLLFNCSSRSPERFTSSEITSAELQQHIKYLASDELGGRKSGEKGNQLAAQYIAHEFQSYGLRPVGDNGGYFQQFDFLSNVKEGIHSALSVTTSKTTIRFTLDKDFRPLSFSSDTSITAPLVFAGYGITADSLQYNDFSDIDVKHKIVVVLRYTPEGKAPDSKYSKYSPLLVKALTAREKGADGIILVTGPLDDEEAKLIPFKLQMSAFSGIAVATMSWTALDSIFHLNGKDLRSLQQQINSTKSPASFELQGSEASLKTEVAKIYSQSANILGYLEGSDPKLKNQVIVLGAHMDHLGMGGEGSGSLQPDTIAIHHGADDNASGTAALLELAQYFSSHQLMLKRSVLFTSYSGEELGLLGSEFYVKHPTIPLEKTVAMLNMDMVGRMKDSILVIEGIGTSRQWEELVKRENPDSSFHLKLKPDGFGPSDHASFYMKDIPVLFFFTNLHSDYHKPSDTWDKINYIDEQRIVQYVARIASDVANDAGTPTFTKVVASSTQTGGDRSGLQVSLGVMPDYAEDANGLKISGTRAGSAAEKAGLKSGDIIVKLDGKGIKNIYDYMYLLGNYKPGDEVVVVVKRGNEEVSLKAKLEARKQ